MTAPSELTPATFRLWLALALVLGGVLRFTGTSELHLTHWDEGPYVGWAEQQTPYTRGEPLAIYAPPLYPLLNRLAFGLFGFAPSIAIQVAALLGLLTIPLIGLLTRRCFGNLAGILAALLAAADPLLLTYSRMALTETTFTTLTLLALLLLVIGLDDSRRRFPILAGAALGLAMCTKYHGFYPLVAAALVLLLRALGRGRAEGGGIAGHLRAAVVPLLVTGLCALPFGLLVLWFIEQQMGLEQFVETRGTWVTPLSGWSLLAFCDYLVTSISRFGSPALLLLVPLGAWLAGRGRASRPGISAAAVWTVLLAPLVLLLILVSYRHYTRLLVPLVALILPLAGAALAWLSGLAGGRHRLFVGLGLTSLCWLPSFAALDEALTYRSDAYPACARLLEERLLEAPGDVIVIAQQSLHPYLSREVGDRAFSITESAAVERLEQGRFRYLLADRRLQRHARLEPHLEQLEGRLGPVFELPNPLRRPILYDRLGSADYRRFSTDPIPSDLVEETVIVLYERLDR